MGSQENVRTTTSTSFVSLTTTSISLITTATTSSTTTTSMLTSTLTVRQTIVTTATTTTQSNSSCANSVDWTPPNGFVLRANSTAPALLCVSYYYYSANSTFELNPIAQLGISGFPLNRSGTSFNARSDFIVSSNDKSFVLGGPSSLNEGKEVTYSILAKPGVNGTFDVVVANLLPGMGCAPDFLLSAGTGVPNYSNPGGCYLIPQNNSTYPLTPGYLFVAWLGGTNSTS